MELSELAALGPPPIQTHSYQGTGFVPSQLRSQVSCKESCSKMLLHLLGIGLGAVKTMVPVESFFKASYDRIGPELGTFLVSHT